ncbi:hypothetical protein [Mobilicoccus massiliensis]|uniref:hypothetical protein n=1 Tax=Mobilicoccus massiliensis TaxID=1522310 RepID=UPI00058EB389|nr:hypothetical protein [Mobilicoccus massiliensis]
MTMPATALLERETTERPTPPLGLGDLVVDTDRGTAVIGVLRRSDPQAWLFAERARYLLTGTCDPYAEQLLRQAGCLRD